MDTCPKLRDLSFLQQYFPIHFGEKWQIPIVKDDDVLWSIVLAYLNSFPESNKNELNHHVSTLLGKKVGRDVKKHVEKCNPFLYKNACFSNETINNMVHSFRERIDDYYKKNPKLFWSNEDTYKCLQASAILLSCNIIFYIDSSPIFLQLFPDFLPLIRNKILVIFKNCSGDNVSSFSFFINKELGFKKQKLALQEILMKIRLDKANSKQNMKLGINAICSLPGLTENFLISLLQSEVAEYISLIYKSPYILSKLQDAAFQIDPTVENSEGKSALFYALANSVPNLLYFIYDHAVNACFLNSGTIRTLDSLIVTNLNRVQQLLTDMKEKMELTIDENVECNSFQKLNELRRFNDFQIEVCRKIMSIKKEIRPLFNFVSEETSGVVKCIREAIERRDVILNVLWYYEKYFKFNDEDLFYDFYMHRDYYDNLDFCSAIIFFDNLFLLKERLLLPPKTYLKVESKFFLFIFLRKYLFREFIVEKSPGHYLVTCMIIFQERSSLKNFLLSFVEEIDKTINEKDTVNKIPESEVRTLTNIPQIYGEFLVLRLKHYLEAAASIKCIDFKAVLILQRTLQVIGESVKEIYFKSVQKVFSLIMPEELLSILKQIRNELSHPKQLNFYHITAEEDYELFYGIQNEILMIDGIFKPIFCAHKYEMEQYASLLTERAVKKARGIEIPNIHKPKLMAILSSTDSEFTNWDDFKYELDKLFEELPTSMTFSTIEEKVINRDSILQLEYILKNMFCSLKQRVSSMKIKCENVKASAAYVEDYFFSVEYVFAYLIIQDVNLKNSLKLTVKSKINERETLFKNAQTYENRVFHKTIEAIISGYEQIKETFLETNCKPGKNLQFAFGHINQFKKILKGNGYLNATEKKTIKKSIPGDIRKIMETKRKLIKFLEGKGGLKLNKEEFDEEISKLPLKAEEQQELLENFDVKETRNSLDIVYSVLCNFDSELEDVFLKNELKNKKLHKDICKFLNLPDSSKDLLSKIIVGEKSDVQQKGLKFLRNRIKQLKAMLIDDNASIKKLWDLAQSSRKKLYVQEQLVDVYLNDPGTQAALEMLLFDCLIILKTTDLCRKASNLYNGINLRNVLAHGNPLLEGLGRLLDPRDLPSELVRKMIDLISDLEIIDSMVNILDKIGHDYSTFIQFMNENEEDEFKVLREKIASSPNWKHYVKLIPGQRGETSGSPTPNDSMDGNAEDSTNDAPGTSQSTA